MDSSAAPRGSARARIDVLHRKLSDARVVGERRHQLRSAACRLDRTEERERRRADSAFASEPDVGQLRLGIAQLHCGREALDGQLAESLAASSASLDQAVRREEKEMRATEAAMYGAVDAGLSLSGLRRGSTSESGPGGHGLAGGSAADESPMVELWQFLDKSREERDELERGMQQDIARQVAPPPSPAAIGPSTRLPTTPRPLVPDFMGRAASRRSGA